MSAVKIKTGKRKTTVSRSAVRKAVKTHFKSLPPSPQPKTVKKKS